MVESVIFHSARPGAGKSTIVANIATLLAARGLRVGLVDANLQDGGLTMFFGLQAGDIRNTLNDFLLERCPGHTIIYDVTPVLNTLSDSTEQHGQILLFPASPHQRDLATILKQGFRIERMTDDLLTLADDVELDLLLIDTHAGIQEETLLAMQSLAIAQTLVMVLRLDRSDYHGTGVTIDVAQALQVPRIIQVANQISSFFDPENVKDELEQAYGQEVVALIPYSAEIASIGSGGLFVLEYPTHPITLLLMQLADALSRRTSKRRIIP